MTNPEESPGESTDKPVDNPYARLMDEVKSDEAKAEQVANAGKDVEEARLKVKAEADALEGTHNPFKVVKRRGLRDDEQVYEGSGEAAELRAGRQVDTFRAIRDSEPARSFYAEAAETAKVLGLSEAAEQLEADVKAMEEKQNFENWERSSTDFAEATAELVRSAAAAIATEQEGSYTLWGATTIVRPGIEDWEQGLTGFLEIMGIKDEHELSAHIENVRQNGASVVPLHRKDVFLNLSVHQPLQVGEGMQGLQAAHANWAQGSESAVRAGVYRGQREPDVKFGY